MLSKIFNAFHKHHWELDLQKTQNSAIGAYYTDLKTGDRKVVMVNNEYDNVPDRKWLSQGSGKWTEEDMGKKREFKVPFGTYPRSYAADRAKGPAV
jgi:hypothetical protein